ncbi:MAG TPA: hypothetical protein VFL42_04895 [Terriglobales bacterium]|nr:hypothetical protein [Terriglobales bacterium]
MAWFSAGMFAAEIKGTVSNATTKKPAAGDEVVVMSLAGGMEEVGHGKTDAKGQFAVSVPAGNAPHLVRVVHQGVNYHASAPPGTASVEVTVYDAAKQVENIVGEARIIRVLSAGKQGIEISEMYILRNESQPPRTKMGEQTLEFSVPEGAQVEEGMAAGPSGMPTNTGVAPAGKKDRYAFSYPLRPGRNQLQVTYKLPYSGTRDFSLTAEMPLAEFGIMLPKGMRFTSGDETFKPATEEGGMAVFVAKSLPSGKQMKISLAGEDVAPNNPQEAPGAAAANAPPGPGGGLGAPNDNPDPLSGARWYIIIAMALALVGGTVWLVRRSRTSGEHNGSDGISEPPAAPAPSRAAQAKTNPRTGSMLDAIKDELFQLESDRLQGTISQQEYEDAKRGLESLLRRHMKKPG